MCNILYRCLVHERGGKRKREGQINKESVILAKYERKRNTNSKKQRGKEVRNGSKEER
jgi:hypothetical protein